MSKTSDLPAGEVTFNGVPFPEDGAMFGWRPDDGDIAALILFYVEPEPQGPVFSAMPRTDVPEASWEPIVRPRFGPWFWDYYRDGQIVDLAPLVGDTQNLVFWVDTISATGSGSIAVELDLHSRDGWTLRRGVYVHYPVIRDSRAPSLDDLLGDPGKADLGPRFQGH